MSRKPVSIGLLLLNFLMSYPGGICKTTFRTVSNKRTEGFTVLYKHSQNSYVFVNLSPSVSAASTSGASLAHSPRNKPFSCLCCGDSAIFLYRLLSGGVVKVQLWQRKYTSCCFKTLCEVSKWLTKLGIGLRRSCFLSFQK